MDQNIELSVVMPCLNEEKGVGICIKKIKEVFEKNKINGEIIVVDNGSIDKSKEISLELGAKVIEESVRGYGAAYLRGLGEAKGKYIIMADSDDTYNFYDIPKFMKSLKDGFDLVMGSRFKGNIQKGAMSFSHRYIGNPILSTMTRIFFRTSLSDIHCGMRGLTKEAYSKMNLSTLGMEFATEMVVGALRSKLKITEVGIDYFPRAGESKLDPFGDAWRHIRFMLIFCPMWLYLVPGFLGFFFGSILLVVLFAGPVNLFGRVWDTHFLIFGSLITIISNQLIQTGLFAHMFAAEKGFISRDFIVVNVQRFFNLERSLLLGVLIFSLGFIINLFIFLEWFNNSFGSLYRIRESVVALTLLVIGMQTIFSAFFLSLLFVRKK